MVRRAGDHYLEAPHPNYTEEIFSYQFGDVRGPEYSTPSRLSAGQTISLEINMTDIDPEEPITDYYLGNPEIRWQFAERFADALLVPAADLETGVERTTWGRLKRETAAGD